MDDRTKQMLSLLTTISGLVSTFLTINEKLKTPAGTGPPKARVTLYLILAAVLLLTVLVLQWDRLSSFLRLKPFSSRIIVAGGLSLITFFVCNLYSVDVSLTLSTATYILICVLTVFLLERFRLLNRTATQYIGSFPANLPAITDLIGSAELSIEIVTDVFAYGAFSDPEGFDALKHALAELKRVNKSLRVDWAAYTPAAAETAVKKQLGPSMVAGSLAESSFLKSERLKHFIEHFHLPMPASADAFLQIVLKDMNEQMKTDMGRSGCHILSNVEDNVPLYVWIVDRKSAMFSVRVSDVNGIREDAFFTQDPALLKVLSEVGGVYWS